MILLWLQNRIRVWIFWNAGYSYSFQYFSSFTDFMVCLSVVYKFNAMLFLLFQSKDWSFCLLLNLSFIDYQTNFRDWQLAKDIHLVEELLVQSSLNFHSVRNITRYTSDDPMRSKMTVFCGIPDKTRGTWKSSPDFHTLKLTNKWTFQE